MSVLRKALTLTLLALVALGFLWPFFVPTDELADKASWFFLAASPLTLLLVIVLITQEELGSKKIALLGILTALIAALRPLGIGAIGIEPMWFALIIASRAMGPTFGFLLGTLSMGLSALLTGGIGPWLSYQIFAAALIGWGTAVIPAKLRGLKEVVTLIFYGILASIFFGIAMDLQFWPWTLGPGTELSYLPGAAVIENLDRFFTYHFISALAWDIPRAILTSTLLALAARPMLGALRRADETTRFVSHAEMEKIKNSLSLSHVRGDHR
jgi:energy-coupling factor transport system substrate-specific component